MNEAHARLRVLDEVAGERGRQALEHGDQRDDTHPPAFWLGLVRRFNEVAADAAGREPAEYRRRMVQIAAITVAAVEAFDRRDTRRKVYVAGPMRGLPEFNYPAFNAAAARFREAGWTVINPAELDPITEQAVGDGERATYGQYMKLDIQELIRVDAIAFLPGAEASQGATTEATIGETLGLPGYDAVSMEPLHYRVREGRLTIKRRGERQ